MLEKINRKFFYGFVLVSLFLFAVAGFEYAVWAPAREIGIPLPTMVVQLWRGDSEEADWLNHRDHGTEIIQNPHSSGLPPAAGYFIRANAQVHLGERMLALDDFQKGKESDPEGHDKLSFVRFAIEGFAMMGHYEDAVRLWENQMEEFPNATNHFSYALFLARTKNEKLRDPARAVELARKGFSSLQQPQRDDHEFFAYILAANSEFEEAIEELEKALSLPAAHPKIAERSDARIRDLIERCKRKEPISQFSF